MNTKPEALRLADALDAAPYSCGCTMEAAEELRRLHAENAELLKALRRLESALDWYLGRSGFTQTTQLKGLQHSQSVRKELFAAHDAARAVIAKAEGKQ